MATVNNLPHQKLTPNELSSTLNGWRLDHFEIKGISRCFARRAELAKPSICTSWQPGIAPDSGYIAWQAVVPDRVPFLAVEAGVPCRSVIPSNLV